MELLIQALAEIKDLQLKWVHFGDGPNFNNLKELAQRRLAKNIDFEFKGRMSNPEVLLYYQKHQPEMFINVSSTEGVPVSIMEAMSFGIPVIATNVGGNSEIVNEKNGILLNPNATSIEIEHAIRMIAGLTDIERNDKMKSALSTWDEIYNAKRNYMHFIETVKEL